MAEPRKKLVLIDAMALIHRAFHAIPFLSTKGGELTNAVFGFTSTVLSVVADLKPDYLAVGYDLPEPTFRHEQYEEYKATRQKAPDELRSQFGRVREVLQTLNIPIFEVVGYEADDVIGALAKQSAAEHDLDVYIVTGDRDSLQLVDDDVKIYMLKWRPGGRETVVYDPAKLKEDTGLTPEEYVDYKALVGDTSDNIPGVPGVGEKTASTLMMKYHDLEGLYAALEEDPKDHPDIKPKMRENLTTYRDQALLSRDLSRIVTDIPLDIDIETMHVHDFDRPAVEKLFAELEFTSLLRRLDEFGKVTHQHAAVKPPAEPVERSWDGKNYHLVGTDEEFAGFLKKLGEQEIFTFDTETEKVESLDKNLVGLAFAWGDHEGYYLPFKHDEGPTIDLEKSLEQLKPMFEDPRIGKVAHHLKYDLEVLHCYGIEVRGAVFDTMLGSYILNPGARTLKLDNLAFQELGYKMQPITELIGAGRGQKLMSQIPSTEVGKYAAEDADVTWQLYQKFEQNLRDVKLEKVLEEIELPLVPVLAAMEEAGVKLDTAFLQELSARYEKELDQLTKDICKHAGKEFNLNSPSQMAGILFDELQIGAGITRRGSKHKTTAAGELEKYKDAHPIVPLILRYRELSKLKTTYVDTLPKLVRHDGRVHTSYNQIGAATGRLSSQDPNLQNIPIRTEQGREIRKAFVAEDGYTLLAADYSQFELRIAAHMSGDERLSQAFKDGLDIHTAAAAQVAGIPLDEVKPEMRYAAKAVNFSILYGATSHGLSRTTGMPVKESAEYIENYFRSYPKLREFMDLMIAQAQTAGYVETLFGRRRYLPEIHSSQYNVREAAKRMAINMPVQGTQADILKLAMIKLHAGLQDQSAKARMLLTVHDELVFEIPDGDVAKVVPWIIDTMEHAYELSVPIVVEGRTGRNWGEMTPLSSKA